MVDSFIRKLASIIDSMIGCSGREEAFRALVVNASPTEILQIQKAILQSVENQSTMEAMKQEIQVLKSEIEFLQNPDNKTSSDIFYGSISVGVDTSSISRLKTERVIQIPTTMIQVECTTTDKTTSIELIKKVRVATGVGLKDAKDFVSSSRKKIIYADPSEVENLIQELKTDHRGKEINVMVRSTDTILDCLHCCDSGIEEIYGGHGTVQEVPCSMCKKA